MIGLVLLIAFGAAAASFALAGLVRLANAAKYRRAFGHDANDVAADRDVLRALDPNQPGR